MGLIQGSMVCHRSRESGAWYDPPRFCKVTIKWVCKEPPGTFYPSGSGWAPSNGVIDLAPCTDSTADVVAVKVFVALYEKRVVVRGCCSTAPIREWEQE